MTDLLTDPEMSEWRRRNGFALLRLMTDVTGASDTPVKHSGDLVLARWNAMPPFVNGWMLYGIGFSCVLNEPDVEVIAPVRRSPDSRS